MKQARSRPPIGHSRVGALLMSLCAALATVVLLLTVVAASDPPVRASTRLRLAAEPGTVRLVPASARIEVGETTDVVVWLEGVEDYYAIDVRIRFDPNLIDVPDGRVKPIWDLFDARSHWIIRNRVDTEAGEAWYAVTNHNPAEPFDGTGRICRITFRALSTGSAALDIHYARGSTHLGQTLEPERAGAQITVGAPDYDLRLTGLVPGTALAGTPGFTLTAEGRGFANGAALNWAGTPRSTAFISSTRLTAEIDAADVVRAGIISVTVLNPGPDAGRSKGFPFTVTNPAPSIAALDPPSATVGALGLTLHVAGSGFVPDSAVLWNGEPRASIVVSRTLLTADLPPTDLAVVQAAVVAVSNPPPGGGTSNERIFRVTELKPAPPARRIYLPLVADAE